MLDCLHVGVLYGQNSKRAGACGSWFNFDLDFMILARVGFFINEVKATMAGVGLNDLVNKVS